MLKLLPMTVLAFVLFFVTGCETPEERCQRTMTLLGNITTCADLDKLAVNETDRLKKFMADEQNKKAKGEALTTYFDALTLFAPGIIALSMDPDTIKEVGGFDDWSREATIIQWKRIKDNATAAELKTLIGHLDTYHEQFRLLAASYAEAEKKPKK